MQLIVQDSILLELIHLEHEPFIKGFDVALHRPKLLSCL